MAEILPPSPVGKVSPEVLKVFRRLKAIPGDDFRCRFALPFDNTRRPEFFVIYRDCFAFVIAVSTITAWMAEDIVQGSFTRLLLGAENPLTPETFGVDEEETLVSFADILAAEGDGRAAVPPSCRVIAFPNVPQALLDRIRQARGGADCVYLGSDRMQGEGLGIALAEMARTPLGPDTIESIRREFSPEIVIPGSFTPARRKVRATGAALTEYLLDYKQEAAVKSDLALTEEGQQATAAPEAALRLITGVAGSGKSLVLLHRAALHARVHPDRCRLILTHNIPLIHELARRHSLLIEDANTTCIHFMKWCHGLLPRRPDRILKRYEQEDLVRALAAANHSVRGLPLHFLIEEIEWIKDYGVGSLDRYLRARRAGRGRPLAEHQRRAVWRLFSDYETALAKRDANDWPGLALRLLQAVETETVTLPRYDAVFVDEAQFFAPVWLRIVRRLVAAAGAELVLAADPTQGFLKRRESWSASGLEVRGRTTRLERAYRNTRAILDFATAFYSARLPDDDEEVNLPTGEAVMELPPGSAPVVLASSSRQDEILRTANEIRRLIAEGAAPGDILVIHCESAHIEPLLERFNAGSGTVPASHAQREPRLGTVRVCSINACTGIEAPVVFVLGIDALLECEAAPVLDADERLDLVRDNTRRLYVAFTRAVARLVLFSNRADLFGTSAPYPVPGD